jgi:hypothetical protein
MPEDNTKQILKDAKVSKGLALFAIQDAMEKLYTAYEELRISEELFFVAGRFKESKDAGNTANKINELLIEIELLKPNS